MTTAARRIQIDINRRDRLGQTPAPYEGAHPRIGDRVVAFEPEDGVRFDAVVAGLDAQRHVVALNVDWDSIRDDAENVPTPARHRPRGVQFG